MRLSTQTEALTALETHYQFMVWLIPTQEKFPRSQKFLLGDRIQTLATELLEVLIDATYTKLRAKLLAQANLLLEKLRYLIRISYDLKHLNTRRYEHAIRLLAEVGKRIGSWVKNDRAAKET